MSGRDLQEVSGGTRPGANHGRWKTEFRVVNDCSPLVFICLANDVWGCGTHWDLERRRTVPCPTQENCRCGKRLDWKCWIPAFLEDSKQIEMVELPRSAITHVEHQMQTHGSLLGWLVRATRTKEGKYGKVMLYFQKKVNPDRWLDEAPSARSFMHMIWGIPLPDLGSGRERGSNSHPGDTLSIEIARKLAVG